MRTKNYETENGDFTFRYNGDRSAVWLTTNQTEDEFLIPFEVLADFVADGIRELRIAKLEQSDWAEVLL